MNILTIVALCLTVSSMASAEMSNQSTNALSKVNIDSINPAIGKVGSVIPFNLTGSGFGNGTQVYLEKVVDKKVKIINALSERVIDPSNVSGKFDLPQAAAVGNWKVNIKHDSLITSSKVNFTIVQ